LNTGDKGSNAIVCANAVQCFLSLAEGKDLVLARNNQFGHCPLYGAAWIDQHNTHNVLSNSE
jgi:hypothetical protein